MSSAADFPDLQKIETKLAVVECELAKQQEHCYLMCRLRDVFNDKTNKTIAELDEYCSQMFGYQEEINDETITTLKRHSRTMWCVLIISALAMAISIAALCIALSCEFINPPFLGVRLFFGDYYSTPFREGFLRSQESGVKSQEIGGYAALLAKGGAT